MEMRKCRLRSRTDGPPCDSSETRPPSQQPRSSHELGILDIQETNRTSNRGKPYKKERKQPGAVKPRPQNSLRGVCMGTMLQGIWPPYPTC